MTPRKIGRYFIQTEIGRGGMAAIYVAQDPLASGRLVAIKVLLPEYIGETVFRNRFNLETKTMATLEHPAIVPVYDFGSHEGQPYFVMRLMRGGSLLDRIIDEGPISLTEASRILSRIASALDEAHTVGVIHCDLKPANILFDEYDQPYLSDFGIAKLAEIDPNDEDRAIVGTPAYMSPELGRGETLIDGRSDIYSLGAILYEMLTGHVPFESDTPRGQVVKHIIDPIPNIRELRPDLPDEVQKIIEIAMAKHNYSRFATAGEFADALLEVANHNGQKASEVISLASKPRENNHNHTPTPQPGYLTLPLEEEEMETLDERVKPELVSVFSEPSYPLNNFTDRNKSLLNSIREGILTSIKRMIVAGYIGLVKIINRIHAPAVTNTEVVKDLEESDKHSFRSLILHSNGIRHH